MFRVFRLSAFSLAVLAVLSSTAIAQSSNWSISNPHPNPTVEFRLAVEEYRNALDRLGLSNASRSIHRFGESIGAWNGSRNDRITGNVLGMTNQIGRDMAQRQLHLAQLRLDNARARLNQVGNASSQGQPLAALAQQPQRTQQGLPPNVVWRDGSRYPAPGFKWVTSQRNDLRVVWSPGSRHPDFPNVLASRKHGAWSPSSGYEWINNSTADLRVRPIRRQSDRQSAPVDRANADGSRVPLGISLRTCADGAHVTHVTSGSPATRCTDDDTGERITLEEGDHVVGVNGANLRTHEQVTEAVDSTDRVLRFAVLDMRTGKIRNLVTVLR